jgi:hypothetical protein
LAFLVFNAVGWMRLHRPAVVVPLDAIGQGFEKTVFLRIPDHFGGTMIDRPAGGADTALENFFVKSFGMEFHALEFLALADRAVHRGLLRAMWFLSTKMKGCGEYSGEFLERKGKI